MKRTIKRLSLPRDHSHDWLEPFFFTGEVTSKFNNLNEIKNLPAPRCYNKNQQSRPSKPKRENQPPQVTSLHSNCKILKVKSQRLNTQDFPKKKESKNERCRTMPDELVMKQVRKKLSSLKATEPKQLCRTAKPTHSKKHSLGSKTNATLPTNIQQSQQVLKNKAKKDVKPTLKHDKIQNKVKPKINISKTVMGAKKRLSEQIGRRDETIPRLIMAQRNIIRSFIDYSQLPSLSSRNHEQKHKIRSFCETSDYLNSTDLKALAQMKLDYQDENINRTKNISPEKELNNNQQSAATTIQNWWRRIRSTLISKQYKHIFNGISTKSIAQSKPFFSNSTKLTNLKAKELKNCKVPILAETEHKVFKINQEVTKVVKDSPYQPEDEVNYSPSQSMIHIDSSSCVEDCCCFFCSECEQEDKPIIRLIRVVVDSRKQSEKIKQINDYPCAICSHSIEFQNQNSLQDSSAEKNISQFDFHKPQTILQGKVEELQVEPVNEFIRENPKDASRYIAGIQSWKQQKFIEQPELDRPLSQMFNNSFNPLSQCFNEPKKCSDAKKEILVSQIEETIIFEFLKQINGMIEKLIGKSRAEGFGYMAANEVPAWKISENEQIQAYLAQLFDDVTSSPQLLDQIQQKLRQGTQSKDKKATDILPYESHISARDLTITLSILKQELPTGLPDFGENSSSILKNEHVFECMFRCINQMLESCSSSLRLYNGRTHYFPSVPQLLQLSMEHTIMLTQLRIDQFDERMCVDLMQWVRNDKEYWTCSKQDNDSTQVKHALQQWIYETLVLEFVEEINKLKRRAERRQQFLDF